MSFFEIFQPGLKYLREEKDRQKMLVSKPTHGGGAPLGIDLAAGVAKIRIPAKPVVEPTEEPADPEGVVLEPEDDSDDEPAGSPT